ncbi:MAG: tetratricopeptide repeat-containing protein, partial [Deltaproteobacteria bacterium]|nr:tetratricopeptide repeat-containing protein [Deltaproteobacteria bacterium]
VQLGQGDLGGALASYRKSLGIRERLAGSDPSNASWQRDLWVSYGKMGNVLARSNTAESAEWFRKALQQLLEMKRRGLFISPADERILQQLRARFGGD